MPGETTRKPIEVLRDRALAAMKDFFDALIIDRDFSATHATSKEKLDAPAESPTADAKAERAPTPRAVATFADGLPKEVIAKTLTPTARAILQCLIQHGACTTKQIALMTGYAQSGSFTGAIGELRAHGAISRGQPITITDAGRELAKLALGNVPKLPPKGAKLREYWKTQLSPTGAAMLEALAKGDLTSSQLADVTGYSLSGSFTGELGRMRALGLVLKGQPVRLAPELRG